MIFDDGRALRAAWLLFGAGAAWPAALGAMAALTMSPLDRALRASWCGGAPHAAYEWLGHCPACWTGAAALFLAGLWLLANRPLQLQGAT